MLCKIVHVHITYNYIKYSTFQEDHKRIKALEKEIKDAAKIAKPAGPSAEEVGFASLQFLQDNYQSFSPSN